MAMKGRQDIENGRRKQSSERRQIVRACTCTMLCCVWCLFMQKVRTKVCVYVCSEPICLAGTLSSIKAMFGLINHDIARSPCGGRPVTCPKQLLFVLLLRLCGTLCRVYGEFSPSLWDTAFGLGMQMCVCKCKYLTVGTGRTHGKSQVPLPLFMSETSG